jgi:hypothetical protein
MPLDVFHRVAEQIKEPPKGLIFVHSVSRCGSTLMSKLLGAIPSVHSISEPDDLSQLVNFRQSGQYCDETLQRLMMSSTKWRCKPRASGRADAVAIKTRSEVLVLADLIGPVFRHSRHLFLYRDAVSWMASIFRGFPADRDIYDEELNRKMETGWSGTLPIVREVRRPDSPMNPVQIRILAWITCMEGYHRLREFAVPICAVRFEDLTVRPIPLLEKLFAFCSLDGVDWEAIGEVLGRDSQAGTLYGREERRKQSREISDELIQDIHDLIATRPLLERFDVVLPGTLELSETA